MSAPAIPDDIRRFILTSIPSIPYLEALLLLRSAPDQNWNHVQIARALYIHETEAASLLDALRARGIAVAGETPMTYRYFVSSNAMARVIDALAAVYTSNLVDVTNLVHARTSRKAQRFADAFIWRKDS